MSTHDTEVREAVADCLQTNGASGAVARLRELIELPLVERLTVVSVNRDVVMRSIERTFVLFATAVQSRAPINWLAWIAATALALAAEETRQVSWLDRFAGTASVGTPHERRRLVVRVVLTIDGECQWRLLRRISRPWLALRARDCQKELSRRLNQLRAAP